MGSYVGKRGGGHDNLHGASQARMKNLVCGFCSIFCAEKPELGLCRDHYGISNGEAVRSLRPFHKPSGLR